MESIIQTEKKCFLCGRNGNGDPLEQHHCIYGNSNRKLAEQDGLVVWICGNRCHRTGKNAVHNNLKTRRILEQAAQCAWEEKYGTREDFMKRYGRNYLE